MNLCVFSHIIILVFLEITQERSGQIHLPDCLPRLRDRLYHVAMDHKFRIFSGWNVTAIKAIAGGRLVSFTGDKCGVIRLCIPGIVRVNTECFRICLFRYGSINALVIKTIPQSADDGSHIGRSIIGPRRYANGNLFLQCHDFVFHFHR